MKQLNPFIIGGPLSTNSEVYIERNADQRIFNHLLQMDYVQITQPRQHGKTSLIFRIRDKLYNYKHQKKMYRLIYVTAEKLFRESEVQWYQELAKGIIEQVKDILDIKRFVAPKDCSSWGTFLLELAQAPQFNSDLEPQIVIAIDEVGNIPPQVAEAFFRMLRAIYNEREIQPCFKRLSFVLIGSFDPADLIRNNNISPFNIAINVTIECFNLEQVKLLTNLLPCSDEISTSIAQGIHFWTGGQPYLTQRICFHLFLHTGTITNKTVNEEVEKLFQEDSKHLPRILKQIEYDLSLKECLSRIIVGNVKFIPSINPYHFKLSRNLGIIKPDEKGFCRISNPIYMRALHEAGVLVGPVPTMVAAKKEPGDTVSNSKTKKEIGNALVHRSDTKLKIRKKTAFISSNKVRATHFGFLHLTDIHCGMKEQNWLLPTLKNRFFKDLEVLHEKCSPWDVVLFSGDLTQFGKAKDFNRVNEFFDELWRHLRIFGSNPSLLAVPGNHDLVRIQSEDEKSAALLLLEQWEKQKSIQKLFWDKDRSEFRMEIEKAFQNYKKWWKNNPFKYDIVKNGIIPGDFSVTIEKNGIKIGIIGLNNSFLHLNDKAKGKLALHAKQLHEVCNGDAPQWLKKHHMSLLMTHHPPDWLDKKSRDHFDSEITAYGNFVIHFCGHLHETTVSELSLDSTEPRRKWQGCSLFGIEEKNDELDRRHGYSAGEFEFQDNNGKLVLWPRILQKQGGQWDFVADSKKTLKDQLYAKPIEFELNSVSEE